MSIICNRFCKISAYRHIAGGSVLSRGRNYTSCLRVQAYSNLCNEHAGLFLL